MLEASLNSIQNNDYRQHGVLINLLLFFLNKENMLKMRRTKKRIIVKRRGRFLPDTFSLHHILS
jgi:hypothetical protein